MSKHIIITGASRGIGFQTAKYLAEHGNRVTAIARSENRLLDLHKSNPQKIYSLPLDITDENSSREIIDHLQKYQLSIDAIIHNAGALVNKPFIELTDEDWNHQLSVNLMAPVRLTRDLIHDFGENAHIVNISSMGGYQGSDKFPGLSAYSTAKGALSILTECLATEFREYGIKVNCLCLGAVQTEMLEEAFPGIDAPVQPEEMAQFVGNFLLTSHKYINGQIIPVTLGSPG